MLHTMELASEAHRCAEAQKGSAMRGEHVTITRCEVTTALLTLATIAFLVLV
jgi:hypothetical protein